MKLAPVTKLDQRNTVMSQKLAILSCRQIMTLSSFLQLIVDLEQSGTRILDLWSIIPTFSLRATFYLIKTKTELKNLEKLKSLPVSVKLLLLPKTC